MNPHIGSRFEDWLKEEGFYEEATNVAIKKVVAWHIQQAMAAQHVTRRDSENQPGLKGDAS